MALEANRLRHPGDHDKELIGLGATLGTLTLGVVLVWGSARIGDALDGSHAADVSGNPFVFVVRLLAGQATWPPAATPVLSGFSALLVLAGAAAGWVIWKWGTARTWVDSRAKVLSTAKDSALLRHRGAVKDARRLGCVDAGPGNPLGRHGLDGAPLWASWEWVQVWILGPRAGKTTTVCVRQVLENRSGPVVATSNKRDLVDYTRGARSEMGQVWVFDPQDIIGERPTWWWNPLQTIHGIADAEEMAGLFAAAVRDSDADTDAYFDPAGQALLAAMLLAAAVGSKPITIVHSWLNEPTDVSPAKILQARYPLIAESLFAFSQLADKQRDGVYGTAAAMVTFLHNDQILPWITPQNVGDHRPQFDPVAFARSRQTIYLISREGRGTARAITAAMTVAIVKAAEDLASHSPSGRVPHPMSVILDEAANVVRWPDLPDLYSHFGSKGIVVSTFLQSWSQGVQVWGREGMNKLWSASNIRVAGASLAEDDFLVALSRLIGERDVLQRSATSSWSSAGRSVQSSLHREPILPVGDLVKMPTNRAVMLASGMPPTLLRLTHFTQTPYADLVKASAAYYSTATAPAQH